MTTDEQKPKRTRPDLATGRTKPWGTKLSEEWVERIREICFRDRIKANDLVERAVDAYERENADMVVRFAGIWEQASPEQRDKIAGTISEYLLKSAG